MIPPRPRRRKKVFRISETSSLRADLVAAVINWRRNQLLPIFGVMVVAWLVGATIVHLAERGGNPAFDTWSESLWNVWVALISGPNEPPQTSIGRLTTVLLMGVGVCLIGLFTGSVASILVENRMRRREVSNFEMEDHLVLCNWAPRGMEWIRQVHSKVVPDKRPVVIIHDDAQGIDLPDTQDDPAFNDVYIVKGDPTNEVVLRRARVPKAHSVVVLTDDRQGEHADGKTILTCVTVRSICRGDHQPNVAVECRNPNNIFHLRKAGADEIISSDELGLRLLARTALYHGMTAVYQELLTVGRDANEMYVLPVPEELVGRDFNEVSNMFLRYRGDRRACLLIGLQREDLMILNPIGDEAGPLKPKDVLILLSRVLLHADSPLPVSPPLPSAANNKKAGPSSS